MIEFSNDNFFIQRVNIRLNIEEVIHLKLVRNGSIAEIFKCLKEGIPTDQAIHADSETNPLIANKDKDMKHKNSQQEINHSKDQNNGAIRVSTSVLSFAFCVIAVLSQIDFSYDDKKLNQEFISFSNSI